MVARRESRQGQLRQEERFPTLGQLAEREAPGRAVSFEAEEGAQIGRHLAQVAEEDAAQGPERQGQAADGQGLQPGQLFSNRVLEGVPVGRVTEPSPGGVRRPHQELLVELVSHPDA